jgi:hypothetical protein
MKKASILFIGILIASISFSQTKRDSLTEVIVNEMCLNMDSLPTDPFFKGQFTMQFLFVMDNLIDKYSQQIKETFGIEDMIEDSAMFLKRNVIIMLLQECNKLQKLVKKNKDDVAKNIKYWRVEMTYSTTVHTKLKKIIYGEICFLEVGRDDNEIERVYWLDSFEGSNDLIENPDKLINKFITLKYEQKRKYNYITKKYDKINVILGITLN